MTEQEAGIVITELTQWCKIQQTPKGDVLFVKSYDADEEADQLEVMAVVNGIRADSKLTYGVDITQEMWDEFTTQEKAVAYITRIEELFKGGD